VKIELKNFFYGVEFMLGMFESFSLAFGAAPRTEVQSPEPGTLIFLIEWR
jgi:hypothetical protein